MDVGDVAGRVHAVVDPGEPLAGDAGDAGVSGEVRVDEHVAVGRRAVSSLNVPARAPEGLDLAALEIGRSRSPDEVDVACDGAVLGVDAAAPEQRVLQADDVCVPDDALVARLHAQRFRLLQVRERARASRRLHPLLLAEPPPPQPAAASVMASPVATRTTDERRIPTLDGPCAKEADRSPKS